MKALKKSRNFRSVSLVFLLLMCEPFFSFAFISLQRISRSRLFFFSYQR